MQNWIRPSGPIQFGSPNHLKTQMQVKSQSLLVLFVHIDLSREKFIDCVASKPLSNAHAAPPWMNKKHFNLLSLDTDKTSHFTAGRTNASQVLNVREPILHQHPEEQDIFFGDEVMGSSHRGFPNLDHSW
jgi:hypothetical protein